MTESSRRTILATGAAAANAEVVAVSSDPDRLSDDVDLSSLTLEPTEGILVRVS